MVTTKKRILSVALGLVLMLAVAACGDDDDTPGTTAPIGDTTTSEPVGS